MEFSGLVEKAREEFGKANVKKIKDKFAFQFDVTGDGGGTFYVEIKDGVLSVEPYEYNDRDARFEVSADTMVKLLDKKLDPVKAFTMGKLKIDGEMSKALELNKLLVKTAEKAT